MARGGPEDCAAGRSSVNDPEAPGARTKGSPASAQLSEIPSRRQTCTVIPSLIGRLLVVLSGIFQFSHIVLSPRIARRSCTGPGRSSDGGCAVTVFRQPFKASADNKTAAAPAHIRAELCFEVFCRRIIRIIYLGIWRTVLSPGANGAGEFPVDRALPAAGRSALLRTVILRRL